MKKKENLVSVYAIASHFAYVIITPLLLFLVGGNWAVKHFELPDWVMGLCVALALIFMLGGAISYTLQLIKLYGGENKTAPKSYNSPRDNDYYDDYKNLRK